MLNHEGEPIIEGPYFTKNEGAGYVSKSPDGIMFFRHAFGSRSLRGGSEVESMTLEMARHYILTVREHLGYLEDKLNQHEQRSSTPAQKRVEHEVIKDIDEFRQKGDISP